MPGTGSPSVPRPHPLKSIVQGLSHFPICPWDRYERVAKEIRNTLITDNFGRLEPLDGSQTNFGVHKRITVITWHPSFPYTYALGVKHGEIIVGTVKKFRKGEEPEEVGVDGSSSSGLRNLNLLRNADPSDVVWHVGEGVVGISGFGPGGAITAIKFDERDKHVLYRTAIDSQVRRVDVIQPERNLIYHDFQSYRQWFTALDVEFGSKTLLAGDNIGNLLMFNTDGGPKLAEMHLHKGKIHHVEFSRKNPNMFVTAGVGDKYPVKVWDIRKIHAKQPLQQLSHQGGVNVARFNPLDGTKLLTSDQENEIRVYQYQGAQFGKPLIIQHPHRKFQHLTPIKAEWHPLADLIVIGSYPSSKIVHKTIDFFDGETGNKVGELFPPSNKIVSLNSFNPTGELLASGMAASFSIWKPGTRLSETKNAGSDNGDGDDDDDLDSSKPMSHEMTNLLRGRNVKRKAPRRAREFSPVNSDDENNENDKRKKRRQGKAPSKGKVAETKKKKK